MTAQRHQKSSNKSVGEFGEHAVAEFIRRQGNAIIERNWRIKEGEIDIVAQLTDGSFIFVEVKTRTSVAFGHPLEAINSSKAHRLQRLALAWLATHQRLGQDYRIDCAAVNLSASGQVTIDYRADVL